MPQSLNRKLKRDIQRMTPRRFEKEYGVSVYNILEKFITDNFIEEDGVLINPDIIDQYRIAKEHNKPSSYMWFFIRELLDIKIKSKNGQASTGKVAHRAKKYGGAISKRVIWDVIVDDYFEESHRDKKLNNQINNDWSHKGIKWLNPKFHKDVNSVEVVEVPINELWDFSIYKRDSLTKLTGEKSLKKFIGNTSQEICIDKVCENETMYFLLNCVMRFGKSFMFFEYIKREYALKGKNGIHVMFCHDTKTYSGWRNKHRDFYSDVIDLVELKDEKDFDFTKQYDKNKLVLVSPQLISSNSIDDVDKPISDITKFNIIAENIFVDEAHQYFTPQWEKYYESIIGDGQIILASGTAANLILKHDDKFDDTNTHTSGLAEFKKNLKRSLNIDLHMEIKLLNLHNTDGSDINLSNLQDIDENGNLVNPYEFDNLLEELLSKRRTSPIYKTKKGEGHFLLLVDSVAAAKRIKEYVLSNHPNIIPINVSGDDSTRDATTEEGIQNIISEASDEDKQTVTISCGSMIQGVSIRHWKNILNLSAKSTYEIYYQLFGRGLEFDDILDRYDTLTRIDVVMWDYNPHRIYKIGAQYVESRVKTNNESISEAYRYFFDIHDITEYITDRNTFTTINEDELRKEIGKKIDPNTFKRGFSSKTILNRKFRIGNLSEDFVEWAVKQTYKNKSQHKLKIDEWTNHLKKQNTNYSKGSGELHPLTKKSIETLEQKLKKALNSALDKIDIVWSVYKNDGLDSDRFEDFLEYYNESEFYNGFGIPKELSKTFAELLKEYGLIYKIENRLSNDTQHRLYNIYDMLDKEFDDFMKVISDFEDTFSYSGVENQISAKDVFAYMTDNLSDLKLTKTSGIEVQFVKSGSLITCIAYYLYKNSYSIFGEQLSKSDIIDIITFTSENPFFDKLIKTIGFMKNDIENIDCIVMNPPYKQGMHMKMFNKGFELLNNGGVICCIHPSDAFINKKPTDREDELQTKNIIEKYESNLEFVNGNEIFDAGFFTPLSITTVTKNKNFRININYNYVGSGIKNTYDSLDKVFIHGYDIVFDIKDKIFNKMDKSIYDKLERNGNKGKYYYQLNRISGHIPLNGKLNPDFFQLIYKKYENDIESLITDIPLSSKSSRNDFNEVPFDDKITIINFHNYCLTKFARFCLSLYKRNQNLHYGELKAVPYLDFSQEWTDERLYEYFELTEEEINFIETYIQDLYERDFK